MTQAAAKLRMSGISKSFPGVKALEDVSLVGHVGEVVGVVGVNGAGKSTLMNILGGILQPDAGVIEVDGRAVVIHSPTDADRHGIAFIHQELLYFASQTVAENIFISHLPADPMIPFLVSKTIANTRAQEHLDMLGSTIKATARMEELSVGEKQIIEVARALATGSTIVIFDEPTSSLSVKEKESLFGIVRKLKSENKTIIYISHFLDEILDLCDSFVVLRNGKLAGQGNVQKTTKSDIIRMVVGKDMATIQAAEQQAHNTPALKVANIRSGNLLNGISFQLNQGEILGIWGLMGSGRTELIRAMTGLDPMDEGQLFLAESNQLVRVAPQKLLKVCGYITENRRVDGLFLDEPVWKNITATNLGNYASGVFRFLQTRQEAAAAREFISSLAIKTPSHDTRLANLSGGNQQKVIFSKWLNKRPEILILDEPTRGVDIGAKQEIGNLVIELAREGTATLLISSEVEEMVALCDRVLVLRDGVIAHELAGDDIDEATLMALALGEERHYA